MTEPIKLRKDGGIAEVLFNRPEAFNAFDLNMIELLEKCLISLAMDDSASVIIISGEGKAFCAGGDLRWALDFPGGPAAGFHELAARYHQAILEIVRMRKPVVAGVNGIAAGGGFSLALACDFRVIAQSAVLRQGYTSNGLCIDGGGTFTLPRLVGTARAMEVVGFDRPISSGEALAWGLVTKVAEDGKVLEEARKMARELGERSLHSFGWCKQLLVDSFHTPFESHIERERQGLSSCAAHPNGQEGLKAFLEKRKPKFNVK
jgi:2-(1,2-epoxy-1,2-dihydrophenyl)acetyl-CoA isomerase